MNNLAVMSCKLHASKLHVSVVSEKNSDNVTIRRNDPATRQGHLAR